MRTRTIINLSLAFLTSIFMMSPAIFAGCTKAEEDQLIDPNKKPEDEGEKEEPDKPIVLDGEIVAYPAISGLETSPDFKVTANGVDIWVEKYDVKLPQPPYKQGEADFVAKVSSYLGDVQKTAFARFSTSGGVHIEIEANSDIRSCVVHPKSRNITVEGVGSKKVSFNMAGADKLYVEIDGMPELYIFADEPETDRPAEDDPNYYYFGPGVHELEGGKLTITNNNKKNVYIDAGALVKGSIELRNISGGGVVVHGRGILDATINNGEGQVIYQHYSQGNTVRDIMCRTATRGWMCYQYQSPYPTYQNVKIIGYGANNDGIPNYSPQGLIVRDCFIRATDDCISLKTEALDRDANVTIENSTMYGVASSDGVMVGYECKGRLTNVTVKNCDIIGGRGSTILGYGHAGFSVCCDGPGPIQNVRFEDVRVENKVFENNMISVVTDGTKYLDSGSSAYGKQGAIEGITLKNVTWEHAGMPIRFVGYGPQNTITNVLIENCYAGSTKIDAGSAYYTTYIKPYIENVQETEIRCR